MVPPPTAVASSSSACLLIDDNEDTINISDDDDDDDRKLPAVVIDNNNNNISNVLDLTGSTDNSDNNTNGLQEQKEDKTISNNTTTKTTTTFKCSRKEEGKNMNNDSIVDTDYEIALQLQKEEDENFEQEQEQQLENTITSKAWKFVQQVLKIVPQQQIAATTSSPQQQQQQQQQQQRTSSSTRGTGGNYPVVAAAAVAVAGMSTTIPNNNDIQQNTIQPVAIDDMVWTAERVLEKQEQFRKANKPTFVDIGYHYTSSTNLDQIRTDGLMSKSERDANNIQPSRYNGSKYGDGIYTANNPYAYQRYGDTGLLVARLCGQIDFNYQLSRNSNNDDNDNNNEHDSTIANPKSIQEIIVLKKSSQCLPVIQFHSSLIIPHQPQSTGNVQVRTIHEKLQKLIDDTFNNGIPTPIPPETNYDSNRGYHPLYLNAGGFMSPHSISSRRPALPPPPPPPAVATAAGVAAAYALPGIASLAVPPHVQQQVAWPLQIPKRIRKGQRRQARQQMQQQQATQQMQQHASVQQPVQQQIQQQTLHQVQQQQHNHHQSFQQLITSNPSTSTTTTAAVYSNQLPNNNRLSTRIFHYEAPVQLATDTKKIYESFTGKIPVVCAICLGSLRKKTKRNKDVIQLISCGHVFHQKCIDDCLKHSVNCPRCRKQITTPRGKMPSGTMTIVKVTIKDCAERNRNKEPGYESVTASMKVELRKVVNDNYWKRAESYLDHFLKEKAKSGTQSAMQLAGSSASTAAPAAISAPTTLSSSSSAPTTAVASVQSSSNSAAAAAAAVAEAKRMQAELQRQQQAAATRAKQKLANQAKQQQRQQQQLMNSNPLSTTTSTGRGYIKRLSNDSIPPARMIDYEAPEQLAADTKNIYKSFTGNVPVDDECAICLNSLQKKSNESMDFIQLTSCGHIFHQHCIHDCLLHSVNCPTCRKQIMTPRGKMPSGTMTIKMTSTQYCSGEENDSVGSYILTYNIPSGVQKVYHPNSGQYHGSAHRVAYLPNNKNGRDLLKRLEYAFQHGLTFMVGTSLTTHQPNSVVWSSIHHKTSPTGGIHGFPDPGYFDNCNNELDNLNVPKADDL